MYSQYWYRAVAAMVLSGRVAATYEGRVNKTDGMRLCKEGNFNPAWLDELSWFLVNAKVEQLLGGEPSRGGRLRFEYCSGVVIPEDEATAKAIRKHLRLKGYLLPNSPPGILIIKPDSDPSNFIRRCRELGFEVNWQLEKSKGRKIESGHSALQVKYHVPFATFDVL